MIDRLVLVACAGDPPPPLLVGPSWSGNALMILTLINNEQCPLLIHQQSVVVDWAWDWPRLLPAYQGMSQVTFKTLLANR